MLDVEAGVLDDEKASGARFFGSGGVRNSLLQPKNFGMHGDGRVGYAGNFGRAPEDVDDVDGDGNVFEAWVGFLAEDFGFVGIDGDDGVADGLEIRGDAVGGARGVGGETDNGDGFGGAEELGDGVVQVCGLHGDSMILRGIA